jgi:hypothetical protein
MVTIADDRDLATASDINEIKINCVRHNAVNEAMQKQIDRIEKNVDKLVEYNEHFPEKLKADFAGKWVEAKMVGYEKMFTKIFISLIVTGVVAVGGLLLQVYLHINK